MVDVSDDPGFRNLAGVDMAADETRVLSMQHSKEDLLVGIAVLEVENRRLRGEVERLGMELRSRGLGHVVSGGDW